MVITTQQLTGIIGHKFNNAQTAQLVDSLNQTFEKYKINTPLRVCHFLAQVLHESGCFRFSEETASGAAYDTRTDLGNTPQIDGDGEKYKGRGFIQITGTYNYRDVSTALGYNFLANPEMLEKYPYNMLSAGWYWDKKNLNRFADFDDIKTITRRVNGGLNGLDKREAWLKRAKLFIK